MRPSMVTFQLLLVLGGDGQDDGHRLVDDALLQEAVEVLALEVLLLSHEA